MIPVFDGHNDALTRDDAADFATGRDGGHLDLPRAREGGLAGGIFAMFTPTPGAEHIDFDGEGRMEIELAAPIGREMAAAATTEAAGRLLGLERDGHVRLVREIADLEALELWYAAGLRSIGPVWSRTNAFAHGVPFAFPASPDTGPGLTAAGRRLVRRCAQLGVAVDLSHLNEAGFWDVARLDEAPLIASHSGVHALCASTRNLTDPQLDAIASSGGLVGIVFAVPFLRADGADEPDTPMRRIVEHVRYAADRIGVEHVALGSDFDGATIPDELGDVAGLPRLVDALLADGFSEDEVRGIAWDNWRRVLARAWGS